MDRVVRFDVCANVGYANQHIPLAVRNCARQARGSFITGAEREHGFVAAAPAAESCRIEQAQIERGMLLLSGIGEGDGHAFGSWRHRKRYFQITMVLRSMHRTFKSELSGC